MEALTLDERSSSIQRLLDEAEEQGYLTSEQILEAFSEAGDDAVSFMAQLEDLFATLYDQGIEVYTGEETREEMAALEVALGGKGDSDHNDAPDLSGIPIDDSVGLYFREMSRVPLLTYEEEVALAKRMEQGQEARRQLARNGRDPEEWARLEHLIEQGEEARQHLIEANTRLVVSIAKRYREHGLPFLDLIQAGNVGLIRAVDKFDYRRGTRFATHATWWIRQAITRTLSQQGHTIRVPVHMSDRIRRLYRTAQELEQDLGHWPTPEDLAEEAELEPSQVRWLMRVWRRPLSLERPVGEERGESEFGDFIEDKDALSPAQSAERHLLREDLERMLTALTPREARILRLRHGLGGDRPHTLKEIGERIGLTRERVRQIERQALRKLRHPRRRRRLRNYLS